jgi:hypothetical protein
MIAWQTIVDDPDQGLHEYKARLAGIDFYIWRAIGLRFGISARRRLLNGGRAVDALWRYRMVRHARGVQGAFGTHPAGTSS